MKTDQRWTETRTITFKTYYNNPSRIKFTHVKSIFDERLSFNFFSLKNSTSASGELNIPLLITVKVFIAEARSNTHKTLNKYTAQLWKIVA